MDRIRDADDPRYSTVAEARDAVASIEPLTRSTMMSSMPASFSWGDFHANADLACSITTTTTSADVATADIYNASTLGYAPRKYKSIESADSLSNSRDLAAFASSEQTSAPDAPCPRATLHRAPALDTIVETDEANEADEADEANEADEPQFPQTGMTRFAFPHPLLTLLLTRPTA